MSIAGETIAFSKTFFVLMISKILFVKNNFLKFNLESMDR